VIEPKAFYDSLIKCDISLFTGVPDSLLKNICFYIADNTKPDEHVIAANEGNALSIGIGYHLATGNVPVVYMQNSGLGNVINPLLSLADTDVYSIPMILLIGWRGQPGVKDEPQHKKQGRVTTSLLEVMEIPYEIIAPTMDIVQVDKIIKSIVNKSKSRGGPCALLVSKGCFSDYELINDAVVDLPLTREDAIKLIVGELDDEDVIVSTTGVASRELYEYRESLRQGHEKDFLTVGGMGHANQIALGIAMQKPDRQVFCFDGDGAMLMHMGSLAINASMHCGNLKHIIFNNGAHDSVGGQSTVGHQIDVQNIAKAVGYDLTLQAISETEIIKAIKSIRDAEGMITLLEIRITKGFRKNLGRPINSPQENKDAFMGFLE